MRTRDQILARMAEINAAADLTGALMSEYEQCETELATVNRAEGIRARDRAYNSPAPGQIPAARYGQDGTGPAARVHPLEFTGTAVDALQDAINGRITRDVEATLTRDRASELGFRNAALTTSTYGAPTEWASNTLSGPRLLHVAAGVPNADIAAVAAKFPKFTLPTAVAAAGEGSSLTEFAASTGGTVTLGRFGRFTDLTAESRFGTDARPILGMHQIGVALDLDKALITAVQTAAGAAVDFADDIPAQIRTAIAHVIASTAAPDASNVVILANPDDVHLLEDVAPVGGRTIAEPFNLFSGALVYPSTAATAGTMTVANLQAGCLYFQAQPLLVATFTDAKTGIQTVSSALVGGYGVSLAAGFAVAQTVVDDS